MDSIRISKMTKAQMHEFFKEFTYDPTTFAEQSKLTPYVYDQLSVDAYYEKHKAQGKLHFAILRADAVIGDLYLKHIDYDKRTCELGIHMVNDRVKIKATVPNQFSFCCHTHLQNWKWKKFLLTV